MNNNNNESQGNCAAELILRQAVDMDRAKRKVEAVALYTEGAAVLMDFVRKLPKESAEKSLKIKQKIDEYLSRAEKLKTDICLDKANGQFRQQVKIAADSSGFGYEKVFGAYIDNNLTQISVEDPYIRRPHQIQNFVRFCELIVKRAPRVKAIDLTTGMDEADKECQLKAFAGLSNSLTERGIRLSVTYSSSLHDREIRFDNGWIFKIGRGLDYFKPCPKYAIGTFEMDLRPCLETTVEVFHKNGANTKQLL